MKKAMIFYMVRIFCYFLVFLAFSENNLANAIENANSNNFIEIPIAVSRPVEIVGCDLTVLFDSSALTPVSARLSESLESYTLTFGDKIKNQLSVGIFNIKNPLKTVSGQFLALVFKGNPIDNVSSAIKLTVFDINEKPGPGGFLIDQRISSSVNVSYNNGSWTLTDESKRFINVDSQGKGKIKINGTTNDLPFNGAFAPKQKLEIIAIPDIDWRFAFYLGDIRDSINPLELTLSDNMQITAVFLPLPTSIASGYYNYSFENSTSNQITVTNTTGEPSLQLTLWLNAPLNNLTAKVERLDRLAIENGYMYLSEGFDIGSLNQIACIDDNYTVTDSYSKTLISVQNLDDLSAKWLDNRLSFYVKYIKKSDKNPDENPDSDSDFALVGPVIIKRVVTDASGVLQVFLSPANALENKGQWSVEYLPDTWSIWLNNGDTYKVSPGIRNIKFKEISNQWKTPELIAIDITPRNHVVVNAMYQILTSAIQVFITPDQAVKAGAKWSGMYSVGWSAWTDSGEIRDGFTPGNVLIKFFHIDGWTEPYEQSIGLTSDNSGVLNVRYCKNILYAPQNITASEGLFENWIEIEWEPVVCAEQYGVFRNNEQIATILGTRYYDSAIQPSLQYDYKVRAIKNNISGDFSETSSGFLKLKPPENPKASEQIYTNQTRIEWDKVTGASLYDIRRNTEDNVFSSEIIGSNVSSLVFDDISGIPCKPYFYWITAKNAFTSSDFSKSVKGSKKLKTPEKIEAKVVNNVIVITCETVSVSDAVEAVEYKLDWTNSSKSATSDTKQGDTASKSCRFEHTDAIYGKQYFYRVRAYNQFGYGDWSAWDSETLAMPKPIVEASKGTMKERIIINWEQIKGAESYSIYKSATANFSSRETLAEKVVNPPYTHLETKTTDFYFIVAALNEYTLKESDPAIGYIMRPECVEYKLKKGLNMISLAVTPENKSLSSIFPSAIKAETYKNGKYETVTELSQGEGYWLTMTSDQSVTVCGLPVTEYFESVSSGWHMKGCTKNKGVFVSEPQGIIEALFSFENSDYIETASCEPMKGVFIKISGDGKIGVRAN